MAYVNHSSRSIETTWLGQRLVSRWPELGERLALYRKYRTTVEELSNLTDRELADFGMDRGSIRDIAREHVYGH
jgi:uncharacterized protein YjiS (DUF1127 family)